MEVTVLGRYSPFPPVGGACNGYLVQHGETLLLLDAGSGVANRLQQYVPVERLTAVLVSHLHEDHIADVHCLRFMQMAAQMAGRTTGKLQVYAPTEPAANHRWLQDGEAWQELHPLNPDEVLVLGALEVRFVRMNHPVPTWAMRIKPVGQAGPVFVYTADTGECPEVHHVALGADLLLIEASLTEASADKKRFGHLSAAEAAGVAKGAGAKRALLTHLWPELPTQELLDEGRSVFPELELAEEGRTYLVGE
jgi:ribonuclease BN (tRNA processing enzyme)